MFKQSVGPQLTTPSHKHCYVIKVFLRLTEDGLQTKVYLKRKTERKSPKKMLIEIKRPNSKSTHFDHFMHAFKLR